MATRLVNEAPAQESDHPPHRQPQVSKTETTLRTGSHRSARQRRPSALAAAGQQDRDDPPHWQPQVSKTDDPPHWQPQVSKTETTLCTGSHRSARQRRPSALAAAGQQDRDDPPHWQPQVSKTETTLRTGSRRSARQRRPSALAAAGQQDRDDPPHWQPQVSMTETFSVSRGTSEWNRVVQRVKETLQDARINKVFRIQNMRLWEKYAAHLTRKRAKLVP